MRILKKGILATLCVAMLLPVTGCSTFENMSKTGQGATVGGGAGAAVGAGVGALINGGKGAWIGALVGGAIGAGTGAAVGHEMDKQKQELEAELASVRELASQKDTTYIIQTVKDSNNLDAIRLVLGSAILFNTGSSELNATAQAALSRIAHNFNQYPDTDITIVGYTDNTGSYEVNMKLSNRRAESVFDYLSRHGVAAKRMRTFGKGWEDPIASNETAEGREQNRRVELFVTANETMINEAGN